ncbi:hypothetical protein CHUAL_012838 [Chamberlinius hualienensis]
MADELSADFDTIVIGTGMPECILAAAHSRNGKTVLHLDRNDYYGGVWATFNFDGLKRWINQEQKEKSEEEDVGRFQELLKDGEKMLQCCTLNQVFSNIKVHSYIPEESVEDTKEESKSDSAEGGNEQEDKKKSEIGSKSVGWSMAKLDSLYRKFNLDLAPKLLFSRGELVELLISSNIARYAEFKSVTRVLTYLDGKLEQVPCSRADVFSTKNVSIVEKRMLMKLLTFCLNYETQSEEYEGYESKPFIEFVKSRKLTDNVQHYVLHAIAMVDDDVSTTEGLKSTKRFLSSLGRYGNTPFLWPIYGSGELPQAFCRLCAVFGGVYYLKRSVEAVILDKEERCSGIISDGKRIDCRWLIMESNYTPKQFLSNSSNTSYISRAILITDRSVSPAEKEQLTLLRLPKSGDLKLPVWVLELGPAAMVSPEGLYVVHLTGKSVGDAESDLRPAVELLFNLYNESENDSEKPRVLWCLFFNQLVRDASTLAESPSNIAITTGPNASLDFDDAVVEARNAFTTTFPGEEFLPRAPDYEDIVIEDQTEPVANPGFSTSEENSKEGEESEEAVACESNDPNFQKEE